MGIISPPLAGPPGNNYQLTIINDQRAMITRRLSQLDGLFLSFVGRNLFRPFSKAIAGFDMTRRTIDIYGVFID